MYTEEEIINLRKAFQAGKERGVHEGKGNYFDAPLDENEWIKEFTEIRKPEEENIPITYGHIKATCGWPEFCDVTGNNHYAPNEWGIEDREIFDVKISEAKKLGFI